MKRLAGQIGLPFDSGPLPERCCDVCGGPLLRRHPEGQRYTYAVMRQRWVKIGMTGNVAERIGVLRRSTEGCITKHPAEMDWRQPLALLVVVVGDVEHELHERFRHLHAAGEWFDCDDALLEWARRHSAEAVSA